MNTKLTTILCTSLLAGMAVTNTAVAFDQGDWLLRFGGSYVNPTSDNHEIVSVDSAASLTFNFSYMMTDHLAVELLAAYPFKHDIDLLDGTKVGSTKHLPPTLNIQYHFMPDSAFQPYIGAGLNYTNFFSEKTTGPLAGSNLSLGDSWGFGAQIGADLMLNDRWFLNADVRYIDIDTKAKLDGTSLGTVKIDPWVYGLTVGVRF